MVQWTNVDANTGAPKYVVDATTGQTGQQQYANTVFGNTPAEVEAGSGSPGWTRVVKGKGKLVSITVLTPGTGYSNATPAVISGQANGTIVTNANGAIQSVTASFANTFVDALPTVTVAGGTGATFRVNSVGRIGRKEIETLVAMRGMAS